MTNRRRTPAPGGDLRGHPGYGGVDQHLPDLQRDLQADRAGPSAPRTVPAAAPSAESPSAAAAASSPPARSVARWSRPARPSPAWWTGWRCRASSSASSTGATGARPGCASRSSGSRKLDESMPVAARIARELSTVLTDRELADLQAKIQKLREAAMDRLNKALARP